MKIHVGVRTLWAQSLNGHTGLLEALDCVIMLQHKVITGCVSLNQAMQFCFFRDERHNILSLIKAITSHTTDCHALLLL